MRTPGPWRLPRVSDSPVLVWGLGTRFPNKFPGAGTRPVWGFPLRTAALVSGWGRGRASDGSLSLHCFLTSRSAFISSSLQHLCAPHSSAEPSLNVSGRKELPLARE